MFCLQNSAGNLTICLKQTSLVMIASPGLKQEMEPVHELENTDKSNLIIYLSSMNI